MGLSDDALLDCLYAPQLRRRVESLLLVVPDENGESQEADVVELQLIEQMRRIGQELLQAWAGNQAVTARVEVGQESGGREKRQWAAPAAVAYRQDCRAALRGNKISRSNRRDRRRLDRAVSRLVARQRIAMRFPPVP